MEINESLIDLTGLTSGNNSKINTPNIKIKKLPKKSILDDLQKNEIIQQPNQSNVSVVGNISNDIVIPNTIAEIQHQKTVNKITTSKENNNKIEELRKLSLLRSKKKNINFQQNIQEVISNQKTIQNTQAEIQTIDINKQLIETYQELTNQELPENIDLVSIAEEIQDAAEEIPGTEDLSINDFEIVENKKGSGWHKNKVTIKSNLASSELSQIATIVKESTSQIVIHRAMDFRTIGNANKTQLKNTPYKLYAISYVFRPVAGKEIKASKYARIAISIPNEFNTTNKVLIFMQESRSKFVTEINCDVQFIAKIISDFYIVGFDVTKQRLKVVGANNPLNTLSTKLMLTRNYLVKPLEDGDGDYSSIVIKTKTGKHQWVVLFVTELALKGTYKLKALSKIDRDWKGISFKHPEGPTVPITMEFLMSQRFLDNLEKIFNTLDWSQFGMGEDDIENKQYYLLSKLTYKPLKKAFIEIYDLQSIDEELTETNQSGIYIKEALSQLDTAKDLNSGYKAEIIIGKSNYIDYFILTWSAVQIVGGDKRHGKDYITTDEYYEKNFVNDKRQYIQRNKTVLKKEGIDRNYNSRPFQFTLVYSVGNKVKTVNAKTFEEIKELSGFLTTNPK